MMNIWLPPWSTWTSPEGDITPPSPALAEITWVFAAQAGPIMKRTARIRMAATGMDGPVFMEERPSGIVRKPRLAG
jgi:hypothetical protein